MSRSTSERASYRIRSRQEVSISDRLLRKLETRTGGLEEGSGVSLVFRLPLLSLCFASGSFFFFPYKTCRNSVLKKEEGGSRFDLKRENACLLACCCEDW